MNHKENSLTLDQRWSRLDVSNCTYHISDGSNGNYKVACVLECIWWLSRSLGV